MKPLAEKVENFLALVLAELATLKVPVYFSTSFDSEITFPCVKVETTAGWNSNFQFQDGERTASITITVESKADDTKASRHNEIAATVEAYTADPATVSAAAGEIANFHLTEWTPGDSASGMEDRTRQTQFTFSALCRDDNGDGT